MNPTQELCELFQQWRLLTEEEGGAITAGAWGQNISSPPRRVCSHASLRFPNAWRRRFTNVSSDP